MSILTISQKLGSWRLECDFSILGRGISSPKWPLERWYFHPGARKGKSAAVSPFCTWGLSWGSITYALFSEQPLDKLTAAGIIQRDYSQPLSDLVLFQVTSPLIYARPKW